MNFTKEKKECEQKDSLCSRRDGIIDVDRKGIITGINYVAEEITGLSEKHHMGEAINRVIHLCNGITYKRMKLPISYVVKNNTTVTFDEVIVLVCHKKTYSHTTMILVPLRAKDGEVVKIQVIFRDLLRVKKMDQVLKEVEMDTILESQLHDSDHFLNQIPDAIWRLSPDLELTYLNKEGLRFFGVPLEQMLGYNWLKLMHPEDREKIVKLHNNKHLFQDRFHCDVRFRMENGNYRWCTILGKFFYDKNEKFDGYLGKTFDITTRVKEEEELKRYELFSKNARDIMLFIDLNGQILEANKAAVLAYGYSYEELLSLNIGDIRGDWSYTRKQIEQASQKGIIFETIHKRKDGSEFYVEVNSQGAEIGNERILLSVIRDITERKETEKKIIEEQAKYRLLFMNMNNGYACLSTIYNEKREIKDLRFLEVNDKYEKMFGITKDQVVGKVYSAIFPQGFQTFIELIRKSQQELSSGKNVSVEGYYSENFQKWISFVLYSPNRNRIVILITDITYLKRQEANLILAKEAAELASEAKSDFLANMSHEIRTPINGMLGMIDLTLLTVLTQDQRERLQIAKSCANNLLQLVNDILDFSKLEAGQIKIHNSTFHIHGLIEEVVKTHAPIVMKKKIHLKYSIGSSIPRYLIGDSNRIRQVLHNLISNAIKFTEQGGICLSVEVIGEHEDLMDLQFTITDTGIGISPKDYERLFDSFSQVENSLSKKYKGAGLGLSISKGLVEKMGGKIGVDSEKGKGSTFYFYIPLGKLKEELPRGEDKEIRILEDVQNFSRDRCAVDPTIVGMGEKSESKQELIMEELSSGVNQIGLDNYPIIREIELDIEIMVSSFEYCDWAMVQSMANEIRELAESIREETLMEFAESVKVVVKRGDEIQLKEKIELLRQCYQALFK